MFRTARPLPLQKLCSAAVALLVLPATAAETYREAPGVQVEPARQAVEYTLSPSQRWALSPTSFGDLRDRPTRSISGSDGCTQTSTYSVPDFDSTRWIAQGGFAEGEIMAATYSVDPGLFPLRIDSLDGLFGTLNATVSTTTEYTVLVWEGAPNNSAPIFSFSSDDLILPHLTMPPGTGVTQISIAIDPSDPEQIIIQNDGTATFTIGFRVDRHNNQTQNPCLIAPPSSSNAFPITDEASLDSPTNNWLFAVNCGPLGCPAGWTRFSNLGLCRPSGDWALAATWTSLSCTPGVGACCLPDGSCIQDAAGSCAAAGGIFQGEGTNCGGVTCPEFTQACCFAATGGCLDLTPLNCTNAGGVPGGPGTVCGSFTCFPQGACCLPDGSCAEGLSPTDCAAQNGVYQGDGTLCANVDCPDPVGACCFSNGFCLELDETSCNLAGATWKGAGTGCVDGDNSGVADDCEAPQACNGADLAEPFGELNIDDVLDYLGAFAAQDPAADLAAPSGTFNIDDVLAFLGAFADGCP